MQSDEESNQIWKLFAQIPESNKKILLSANIIENLYRAEQQFGWDPYCSARLAYFVRELFFQTLSQSEFYKATEALFRPRYQARYNEILTYINNVILTSQPDPEEEEEEEKEQQKIWEEGKVKQLSLLDAMGRYPGVAHQFLTENNIKLKSQAALVRPTLSNWLKNYRDEIGIGKHDAVARANFLFESLNTKQLSSEERERLHTLIRSLEDNELLDIDTEHQVILFARAKQDTRPVKTTAVPSESPLPDVFERFQKSTPPAPVELKNVGTQTFLNSKVAPEKQGVITKVSPAKSQNMFPARRPDTQVSENTFQPMHIDSQEEGPMGAIRFSAKHVLPAEKYEKKYQASPLEVRPQYPRPENQAPKKVVPQAPVPPLVPTPPQPVAPPQPTPVPPVPEKVIPKRPEEKRVSAGSIFRIKPTKD